MGLLIGIIVFPLAIAAAEHQMNTWFWVAVFNAVTVPLTILRCSVPGEPYPDSLARAGSLGEGRPKGIGPLGLPFVHAAAVFAALISLVVGRDFARRAIRRLVDLREGTW